jgi:hypothetical protein
MPKRVRIVRWTPHREPRKVTLAFLVPRPERMAEIAVKRLQAEVLGKGADATNQMR